MKIHHNIITLALRPLSFVLSLLTPLVTLFLIYSHPLILITPISPITTLGAPGREDYGRARAIEYIRSTWGKRCDGYLAISNVTDHNLSTIHVEPMRKNWTENYHEMWLKAQLMWKLVGSSMLDEYDYFLIGKLDTAHRIRSNLQLYT